MEGPTCAECGHYFEVSQFDGRCRRRSPVVVQRIDDGGASAWSETQWPRVDASSRCGEFVPLATKGGPSWQKVDYSFTTGLVADERTTAEMVAGMLKARKAIGGFMKKTSKKGKRGC